MATSAILGAAAIAGAASAVGAGLNSYSANMANKWNRREAEKNRQWQEEMWTKQNDYNLPVNQLQRLKDAGLNPNLAFGQSGLSNVASSFGAGAQAQQISPQYGDLMHGVTNAVDKYMDYKLRDSEIAANSAKANKDNASAGLDKWQLAFNETTEQLQRSILWSEDQKRYWEYANMMKKHGLMEEEYLQARIKTSELEADQKAGFPRLKQDIQRYNEMVKSWDLRLKKIDLENRELIMRAFMEKWQGKLHQSNIKLNEKQKAYIQTLIDGKMFENEILGTRASYKEALVWLEMIGMGADAFSDVMDMFLPTGKIGKAFKAMRGSNESPAPQRNGYTRQRVNYDSQGRTTGSYEETYQDTYSDFYPTRRRGH